MDYRISYACASHKGYVRRINQDNYISGHAYMDAHERDIPQSFSGYMEGSSVFGVFDGIGGGESGEEAAFIAAKEAANINPCSDAKKELMDYCYRANREVCRFAEGHGIWNMGTTAAVVAFAGDAVTVCNIGDSRIFKCSAGRLEQLSVDHVSPAPFGCKPYLSQHLGIPSSEMLIEPYISQDRCRSGDIYIICSDGLTDMVPESSIAAIAAEVNSGNITEALLEAALKNGGKDNVTIISCKVFAG